MKFGTVPPDDQANQWRYQLDKFVQDNQQSLAALAWGLKLEWGENKDVLGIDLKPQPHFICCSRQAIEDLNKKVDRQIQEVLGILDGYNPQEEVAIIGIGTGQIKLIHFKSNPSPPLCFEQIPNNLDELIQKLEQFMIEQIKL
ncbi:beta-carboxysome assembly chaperone CcmS [Aphanothece sacrum]|nr:hypothetical protein [Aphanothece sacrum]